ncbi:hypothetical protein BH20ACI2_BH20ACI2_03360 [soil metagenome]
MQIRAEKWILPAVIGLHLAITLPGAYYLNIWVDEASSLYATQQGFWTAFQNAAAEQKQAPLYFWILSLWRSIDGSIFFARLFSIICSVAAIKLFAGLASRILDHRGAMLLTAFFGLHPFLIWASLEIRVYSLVILLSIVLIRLFFLAFWGRDQPETSTRPGYPTVWFLIAIIVALYTNYYLGFLVAGLFAALIVARRWREARLFAFLMVGAALAFFPLFFEMIEEFRSKTSGFQPPRTLPEGLRGIWNNFLTFVLPTEIFPASEQSTPSFIRVWIVRIAGVVIAGMVFWKRKQITSTTICLAVISIMIGLFLLAAYFLVGSLYIQIRHASVLFVPLTLFLASLLADLFREMRRNQAKPLMIGSALLVIASFAYSISVLYPNMTKRGDWARVAEFIQQNESPGQPIVLFAAFDALALPYYYHGVNPIFPDENYFDFGLQAPAGSAGSLVRQNEFVISEIPPKATELWLVVNEQCVSSEACRPLENYLAANYTIELEREFYLSKVIRLKAKTQ